MEVRGRGVVLSDCPTPSKKNYLGGNFLTHALYSRFDSLIDFYFGGEGVKAILPPLQKSKKLESL